ncbi:hypothetical protein HOH87_04985 [bacterium]|jgi:hypothetical protein|nr:hypothetical protein [bacterium]
MKFVEFLEPAKNDFIIFNNFIIFEPASHRIPETDILLQGDEVRELFDRVMMQIGYDTSLETRTLANRLNRIQMMLDLVKSYDNIIISKFLNKVWKRYAYFSNLGEMFLNIDEYTSFLPEFKGDDSKLIVQRIESEEDMEAADAAATKDEASDKEGKDEADEEKGKDEDKKKKVSAAKKPAKKAAKK